MSTAKPVVTAVAAYLHVATLQRLLVVLAFVLLPHFVRLPKWETAAVLAVLAWRVWAARRHIAMPGKLVRAVLALAAFAGVFASYGKINGQHAGVALVVIMAALKLTEMDKRRDVMVLVFLMYFICVTHFLFSQEIWTLGYLLLAAAAITAVLIESNHAGEPLPLKVTTRRAGALIAQALPLMLVMFVLFPRIPGPLWGLPSDAGASRSGLSDKMSPGDIASLILSDELAFRVQFDGAIPAQSKLYWRGPVFWDFDGREWTEGGVSAKQDYPVQALGGAVDYEVTLEPTRTPWLLALDAVDAEQLPPESFISADGRLLANEAVRERKLYRVRSNTRYLAQPELRNFYKTAALRLPRGRNPRAAALAQQWRAQGLDDAGVIDAALTMYRQQQFVYTLKPPALGREAVDEFLFDTRRGFCEHYASSFTVLMRAAGIPARVVTGYQGGAASTVGKYLIVRQSEAHAWSEVWLPQKGWLRVDPTAAVAPDRIERDLSSALSLSESASLGLQRNGNALWGQVQARWDWTNAQWNRWVLAYGPELQNMLMSRFGLQGWRDLMLAMIVALSIVGGLFGLLALRRAMPAKTSDAALAAWQKATRRLAKEGLIQRPHEGPEHFAHRVAEASPAWASSIEELACAYIEARYVASDGAQSRLRRLVASFKRGA